MGTATPTAYEYPTPERVECPFGFYRTLRDGAPVALLANGDYAVSRWEDAVYVARHPEIFSNAVGLATPGFSDAYTDGLDHDETLSPWPVPFTDPPEHRRKRSLLLPVVARERLEEYDPVIREIADGLIDGFADRGSAEFKAEFAQELPPAAMLRILGVPEQDAPMLRGWLATSQGAGFRHATEEQRAVQAGGRAKGRAYFRDLIQDRAERPVDDLLGALVHAKLERDGVLDLHYMVGEVTNLYSAAYHNTVYMLSNAMIVLLEHPDVLDQARADPSLIRPMVEEAMRLESPVQWMQRVTMEDTVLGGVAIPKGAVVLVLWASGNRDERQFPEPERFVLNRPGMLKSLLAFGHGPHLCLGAPLARLEAQVSFEQLLARLPGLRLGDGWDGSHIESVNHRAPSAIPIVFDPVPR